MKKKMTQKLQLSRETLRSLNSSELLEAAGGVSTGHVRTGCDTCSCVTCPVGRSVDCAC
jgi:hypothetical protein